MKEEIENFVSQYKEVFNSLSEERKNIFQKVLEKQGILKKTSREILQLKEEISKEKDKDFISLAKEEIKNLSEREKKITEEIKELIERFKNSNQKADRFQKNSVIFEIRAGTGGEEAALFARDLFRMYTKYAESQNWKIKILDERRSDLSGIKEIVFELSGKDVWEKMRFEGGVHRVQRIPVTEKGGRIHTSTATVAVLPKPKKAQVKIKPEDLKIEFYKASGPGGQYVNKRETAVRIVHLPTGISVSSQTERSQRENKENALAILEAKILKRQEEEFAQKMSKERRSQIKKAERSEKIRTYNFPQDRVTDHRIKKTWHNIDKIMEGKIDKILETLAKELSST